MPGDINIEKPSEEVKDIFVACAVTRVTLDICKNKLESPTSPAGQAATPIPAPIPSPMPTTTYPVTINYDASLADMIRTGRYDWVNPNITEKNFPVKGKGIKEVVIELTRFNRLISSDDALSELEKRGLRPATIEEFLAFGAAYPEVQQGSQTVTLGSVWRAPGWCSRCPRGNGAWWLPGPRPFLLVCQRVALRARLRWRPQVASVP